MDAALNEKDIYIVKKDEPKDDAKKADSEVKKPESASKP